MGWLYADAGLNMMNLFTLAAAAAAAMILAALPFQIVAGQAPTIVALTGARVIDGTGSTPIETATILINNGTIQSVGSGATVQIPSGATRVDVSGKTIIPGIINAHGHLSSGDEKLSPRDRIVAQLQLYADYGVTTVYSLGSDDGREAIMVRDAQAQGKLDGARLYVSSPSLSRLLQGKTVADARQLVDREAAGKVNIIKIHVDGRDDDPNKLKPEMYRAIIDQAAKHGLKVAAHLYYLNDAKGLVDAGVDVIAHSIRDRDVDAALVAAMKQRNVGYIPTLTRDLSVFVYETTPAFFSDPFFLRRVDAYRRQMDQLKDPALQEKTRVSQEAQRIKQALQQAERNLKLLSDGGVTIAMGTDSGVQLGRWQGYFEHTELELMVKSGLTPMQTLVASTSGAARAMRLDARVGSLQPGKWADFVVLSANPLSDIRNTQKIDSVWIAGRRLPQLAKTN